MNGLLKLKKDKGGIWQRTYEKMGYVQFMYISSYVQTTRQNIFLVFLVKNTVHILSKSMNLFDWLFHVQWERYLESYLQEAEWIATGYVPSFDEYLKNGQASSGMSVLNLIPLLLMGQILPDDILQQIFYPSKIHELLELTVRLKDDITDFEVCGIKISIYF